jgi:hypothetical protein
MMHLDSATIGPQAYRRNSSGKEDGSVQQTRDRRRKRDDESDNSAQKMR